MTKIYNDPAEFADDQLAGFLDLYSDRLRGVHGGVVRLPSGDPQVAVVIGGGSGHYPAFCGTVGPGLATGAVVGNIFTSPSAAQAWSVGRAADAGRGVVFSFGNYAGDTMNFGIAADRLREQGIDTRVVVVTDDVASADEEEKRRGIAGDFTVFKVMGAAAAEGSDLDEVERLGRVANAATRSLGVAFAGCTMPGSDEPLFTVPEGHLGLGLGIHGEPGISDVEMLRAHDLASLLVDRLLAAAPERAGSRVGVILNGLGTTKYEELFLLWGEVAPMLRGQGLELVQPEVGELVTSLDMGGCSLTLMWLDEDLERLWCADTYTPAYRKIAAPLQGLRQPAADELVAEEESVQPPAATEAAQRLALTVTAALEAVQQTLGEAESELGRIDAVAGDGDHGRGMVKGIRGALTRLERAPAGCGGGWLLQVAGQGWAEDAGGTSGVLWGAALEAFGRSLGDDRTDYDGVAVIEAVRAFTDSILSLGGAAVGDKTMLDSLVPFTEELSSTVEQSGLVDGWRRAAAVAVQRAEQTQELRPQVGRARPLAEKSVGTPDAGATSMGLILTRVGEVLAERTGTTS